MAVGFSSYIELLSEFLERRREIVEHIENRLLNVRGKATSRNRNRDYFDQLCNACFFDLSGLPRDLSDPLERSCARAGSSGPHRSGL
jgi:hypothetical protein